MHQSQSELEASLRSRHAVESTEDRRHFDVDLFIVHPTLDPADISAALGLEAKIAHGVGDRRKTPKGRLLVGSYKNTRWRHSRHFEACDQWFASDITELVHYLEARRDELNEILSTGGRAEVIIQFLGDGYFGDIIPIDTLNKLAKLRIGLGIESFDVPQTFRSEIL